MKTVKLALENARETKLVKDVEIAVIHALKTMALGLPLLFIINEIM